MLLWQEALRPEVSLATAHRAARQSAVRVFSSGIDESTRSEMSSIGMPSSIWAGTWPAILAKERVELTKKEAY